MKAYPQVGLNADWYCATYQIQPTVFLCDLEDGQGYSVVRRDMSDPDDMGTEIALVPTLDHALSLALHS
jgi:hypothetical protein